VAEIFTLDLTITQGEVILKALDLCGANGDLRAATQHFNDIDLAQRKADAPRDPACGGHSMR